MKTILHATSKRAKSRPRRKGTKLLPILVAVALAAVFPPAAIETRADGDANPVLEKLELRSILSMGGPPQFSIHDRERDISFWISLHQSRHGIEIAEYDPESDQVVVRYQEQTRRLGLSESKVRALEEPTERESPRTAIPWAAQRGEQRSPEEMTEHVITTWENEVARNPRIREIDEHLREYYQEFGNIRQRMWATTDQDSREFQELRQRRNELRDEIRVLSRLTARQIEGSEVFQDIEGGQLIATLRHQYLQRNESSRD